MLASGDPFCHGVGTTLARHIAPTEMLTIPAPSAFSLAAGRLGWALPEVETVSLHGKPIDADSSAAASGRAHSGADLRRATGRARWRGCWPNRASAVSGLTVLEALGGPDERLRTAKAASFDLQDINALNILAIEIDATPQARTLPLTPGMPDDLFEHDGQITKREIRALTLSALAPLRGELLWDIGAGRGFGVRSNGCCGIRRCGRSPSRPRRSGPGASAATPTPAGSQGSGSLIGTAPAALAGLPPPDAIFVGGGGSETGVMDAAIEALKPGGRLVANAVTLEMEAVLIARHAANGGELTRIAISRAAPVGTMQGWRPAMPVTQWAWRKP